jgi:hypothetical protein
VTTELHATHESGRLTLPRRSVWHFFRQLTFHSSLRECRLHRRQIPQSVLDNRIPLLFKIAARNSRFSARAGRRYAGRIGSLLRKGFLVFAFLNALFIRQATAQLDSATLSGQVLDSSGAGIRGARVRLVDVDRNTRSATLTDSTGLYIFPGVQPGLYRIEVSASGFKSMTLTGLTVGTGDSTQQNVPMSVGPEADGVTLQAGNMPVQHSGTVSTVVDQNLVRELPLNGRSFQTLFQLTPGTVITPTSFASPGQFSVNGQRTDTNYVLIDGVSANFGISVAAQPGQSAGGSLPALTAFGGTNSLVSTDDVQEFAVLTSSFAPEFGRTPGGQVSVVTRSGTNEVHGTVFDYLRNDAFDANDWFANQHQLSRAALRQNDFGGVLGAPIQRNKTFGFLSYEGLRLRQPTTGESDVPSIEARKSAPPEISPFLNAYPHPTGPSQGDRLAPAIYTFSNPSRLDTVSVRADHHLTDSMMIFGRYNASRSNVEQRGADITSLSSIIDIRFSLQTLTLGLTSPIKSHFINDTRVNWSRSSAASTFRLDNFGSAVPVLPEAVFPAPFSERNSFFLFLAALSARNPGLAFGRNTANIQTQVNVIENLSWELPSHLLRAGMDLRRLSPEVDLSAYAQVAIFSDVKAALNSNVLQDAITATVPVKSTAANYSCYVQDTWRPHARLTATYGMRWDYNPLPGGRSNNGLAPFAVRGIRNLPTLTLAPPARPIYKSTVNNFAPRVGLAYSIRNSSHSATILRGGAGIVHDFGNGPLGNAFSGSFFPFSAVKVFFGVPFPLNRNDAAPPPITANPPFAPIIAFPSILKVPSTYQWNLAVEQRLGSAQTLVVSYVGAVGRNLLRSEEYLGNSAGLPGSFRQLFFTNNSGYSNYNAMQAQIRRRANKGLDVVASYTWSHSFDNVSTDAILDGIPARFLDPHRDYGPSDFDIRHTAAIGVDYQFPSIARSSILNRFWGGWSIDSILMLRSSPPVDVQIVRNIGFGVYSFRPDLVPGVRMYVDDPTVPGRMRFNPAALSIPLVQRQGTLRRNHFRGFPLAELDIAVRRRFHLRNSSALEIRAEAFNVFNHPNFAPEVGLLGNVDSTGNFSALAGFGVSPSTLARGLHGGQVGSGFSSLYQIGQSRTLQVALKLEF